MLQQWFKQCKGTRNISFCLIGQLNSYGIEFSFKNLYLMEMDVSNYNSLQFLSKTKVNLSSQNCVSFFSLSLSPTCCYYHCFNHCKYFVTVKAIWITSISFVIGMIKYFSHVNSVFLLLLLLLLPLLLLLLFLLHQYILLLYVLIAKSLCTILIFVYIAPQNQALHESTLYSPK